MNPFDSRDHGCGEFNSVRPLTATIKLTTPYGGHEYFTGV